MRLWIYLLAAPLAAQIFDRSADIGSIERKGSMQYEAATNIYRLTGSGANMWATADAFHFAYKQVTGDVTLTTDVDWTTRGGNAHKKAGPVLRAGLDAGDAYADAIAHADGLISFQYRLQKGGPTAEVRTAVKAPATLRIARHGDVISVEVAPKGEAFQPIGALTIPMPESIYAGLAVCSHDASVSETAVFSNVQLNNDGAAAARIVESTLETIDIETGRRRIVRRALEHFEAPNWSADGRYLYYNGGGSLWRIPSGGGTPKRIATGDVRINNDHGLSPDGKAIAISGSVNRAQSQIFLIPMAGGTPRLLTPLAPSYWHGWSPDAATLAYCAQRNGNYDIYTMPAGGGAETRLTTAEGLDDGPDYSPDGKTIFFNSERSGLMRVWRMNADGSQQTIVSEGPETADWFPHPSPDGKWIVYLSYEKSVKGHPPNKDVQLRLAPASGGPSKALAILFGGQGTNNVNSWSPDGRHLAFVSYRLVANPEAQIRALLERQPGDWNRGDIAAFMQAYENSDTVTFIGAEVTKGYKPVLESYGKRYANRDQMGQLRYELPEIRLLGEDHAFVFGRFFLTRTEQGGGNKQGKFTLLLRRTEAGWKIVVDHTS